ncbi:MAG: glycerol-3-phosphate dehydrogenase/oxidase [Chloroflexota bacterium]
MKILNRTERLNYLKENPEISVLIIGAGINGIGTFRDLGLQGLDVVLVDRGDYCSGASAASSHMVHGGIRYLENGEFTLVREAVKERNRLIENAPHLVNPLPTTFPIFKLFSGLLNAPLKFLGLMEKPAERGAFVIKIGMVVYDFFTRAQKTVPKHIFRNREKSLENFPDLNPKIIFTGTYYDGSMPSPERIAVELLKDTVKENSQAIPLNYVKVITAEQGKVIVQDEISGEKIALQPEIVVNSAGPWIDLVNDDLGEKSHFISGTKGSHVIMDHPQLRKALGENELFFENKDGRIVLIFPIEDKVMIGTSDLRIEHPDDVVITDEEIDYFFEMVARVFPKISLDRSQIVYTFSGVRPLQYTAGGRTGQISRNHKVGISEPTARREFPILSLIGGKWTSFRAFSEQATDKILSRLGVERRISTADLKIGGSNGLPIDPEARRALIREVSAESNIDKDRFEELLQFYGMQAIKLLHDYPGKISETLSACPEISAGEIEYFLEQEDVVHLDDLILRRTMLGKLGRISLAGLNQIAEVAAKNQNWTDDKRIEEVNRTKEIFEKRHIVNLK